MDFEREDKIISDFLRSIGPWSSQVVIGGGYAPIIYRLYLSGEEEGNPPVGTRDIDSIIPRKIPQLSKDSLGKCLKTSGFTQTFKDRLDPATESFFKTIEGVEMEIEFLTDNSVRINKEKNVLISGVVAQSLSYLKLSLENRMPFVTNSGEKGFVVSPEAWMFHKGLTFPKRSDKLKIFKDLYGIWYVGTQLGDFSIAALDELKNLFLQQPKWHKTFKSNISNWLEDAAPIDWLNLESQDPFGNLKKLSFERFIRGIIE